MRPLRVLSDSFPEDPALDTAVSDATMQRVAAGELPETLRLARPGRVVAFAKRDKLSSGYAEGVDAARALGFGSVLRLAGGRAAVFHEGTLELAHAVPSSDPRGEIHARFEATAELVTRALRRLGVDARVGEVAGEYCPGRWSVNADGKRKLAGSGQRVIHGGAHVGTVLVAEGADSIRAVLEAYATRYELVSASLDPATLALARTLERQQ